ncbi:C6 zinc finger domain protein [Fusarium tjaetaba]|uniref:C6 zinc finger domain protein n=1 Tax=Fusarium tjaetaba TaxID=1567544 RepID=A0A8H5QWB2_9HYPO|nr:C6 zinc finger domain protein [Fusarium tjaetaba]KAF5622389.1 C6 zinc finger domain protein [Fusarium tjaetaba]
MGTSTIHPSQRRLSCDVCKRHKTRCLRIKQNDPKCARCTMLDEECSIGGPKKVGRPRKSDSATGQRKDIGQPQAKLVRSQKKQTTAKNQQREPIPLSASPDPDIFLASMMFSPVPIPSTTTSIATPPFVETTTNVVFTPESSWPTPGTAEPQTSSLPQRLPPKISSCFKHSSAFADYDWNIDENDVSTTKPSQLGLTVICSDPARLVIPELGSPTGSIELSDALSQLSKLNNDLHIRMAAIETHRSVMTLSSILFREGPLFIENLTLGEFTLGSTQDLFEVLSRLLNNRSCHAPLETAHMLDIVNLPGLDGQSSSPHSYGDGHNGSSPSFASTIPSTSLQPLLAPLVLTITGVFTQLISLHEVLLKHITLWLTAEPLRPISGLQFGEASPQDLCAQGVRYSTASLSFLERIEQILGITGLPEWGEPGLLSMQQIDVLWSVLDAGEGIAPGHGFMRPAYVKRSLWKALSVMSRVVPPEYHNTWIESPEHWKPVDLRARRRGVSFSKVQSVDLVASYESPFARPTKAISFSIYPWNAITQKLCVQSLKPRLAVENVFTLGSSWLIECQSSHPRCTSAYRPAPEWLPTRLLDIGEEGLNTWKLPMGSDRRDMPTVFEFGTVSHPRPIAHLPILFRDVIKVSRRFSVRYLWIDALCIMPDSKDDWEREAPTMQYVYSNSVFTIAATGSDSPDDTLLHARDLDLVKVGKAQCSLFSDEPQPCIIYDSAYWERQLWIPDREATKELDTLMEVQDNTQMTDDLAHLWCRLVQEYCECSLTFPSDKLHAMAGIAKLFETVTGDEYVAGLWRSRFIELLHWSAAEVKPLQSTDYRAPSWSWASIDSRIWYWARSSRATNLADLVDISVLNQTSDRMSTVLSACAVVRARVIPAACKSVGMEGVTFRCHNNEFKVDFDPDTTSSELIAGNEYAYMPLILDYNSSAADKSSMERNGFCLILERDQQSISGLDRYRRLGSFHVKEGEYCDNVEDILYCTKFTEIEMI